MGCISPSVVHRGSHAFLSPCGKCSQCVASKVSAYTFLVDKEMQSPLYRNSGSSFVDLTYDNNHLPISSAGSMTLVKSDLQKFFKRLRINFVRAGYDIPLKYVSCGEYGTDFGRPHYHIALLGVARALAEPLCRQSWSNGYGGFVQCGVLELSGVSYVLKYLSKAHPFGSVLEEYNARQALPPFVLVSKGLGLNWVRNHINDIVNDGFCYRDPKSGEKRLFPRRIREYVEAYTGVDPRPYVDNYMKSIDTHGMTLDDYNSFRDYNNARNAYLKSIKNGKPEYILSHCRLPPRMRSISFQSVSDILSNL